MSTLLMLCVVALVLLLEEPVGVTVASTPTTLKQQPQTSMKLPLEIQYPSEQLRQAEHEYHSLMARSRPELGCFSQAMEHVTSESCGDMSEEERRRLGLELANCHFEATGRVTYACPKEKLTKECISNMREMPYIVFTQFFQQATQLCIYIRAELWAQEVQSIVNELAESSDSMNSLLLQQLDAQDLLLHQTNLSISNQASLIELQEQTKESLWTSMEPILRQVTSFDEALKRMDSATNALVAVYAKTSGNIAGIYSIAYYIMLAILTRILTSTNSTEGARIPILLILLVGMSIEISLQSLWSSLCVTTVSEMWYSAVGMTWGIESICQWQEKDVAINSARSLTPISFFVSMLDSPYLMRTRVMSFTVDLETCRRNLRLVVTTFCGLLWVITCLTYRSPMKITEERLHSVLTNQEEIRAERKRLQELVDASYAFFARTLRKTQNDSYNYFNTEGKFGTLTSSGGFSGLRQQSPQSKLTIIAPTKGCTEIRQHTQMTQPYIENMDIESQAIASTRSSEAGANDAESGTSRKQGEVSSEPCTRSTHKSVMETTEKVQNEVSKTPGKRKRTAEDKVDESVSSRKSIRKEPHSSAIRKRQRGQSSNKSNKRRR